MLHLLPVSQHINQMPGKTHKRNGHDRAGARTHRAMIKTVIDITSDIEKRNI